MISSDDQTNPEDREAEDLEVLKRHTLMLSEHFDTVQIIVTRSHSSETILADQGCGNWYARYGAAKAWLTKLEHAMRLND